MTTDKPVTVTWPDSRELSQDAKGADRQESDGNEAGQQPRRHKPDLVVTRGQFIQFRTQHEMERSGRKFLDTDHERVERSEGARGLIAGRFAMMTAEDYERLAVNELERARQSALGKASGRARQKKRHMWTAHAEQEAIRMLKTNRRLSFEDLGIKVRQKLEDLFRGKSSAPRIPTGRTIRAHLRTVPEVRELKRRR